MCFQLSWSCWYLLHRILYVKNYYPKKWCEKCRGLKMYMHFVCTSSQTAPLVRGHATKQRFETVSRIKSRWIKRLNRLLQCVLDFYLKHARRMGYILLPYGCGTSGRGERYQKWWQWIKSHCTPKTYVLYVLPSEKKSYRLDKMFFITVR